MFRESLAHIGMALREPEEFAWRWHQEVRPYPWWVFAALSATAAGWHVFGDTLRDRNTDGSDPENMRTR